MDGSAVLRPAQVVDGADVQRALERFWEENPILFELLCHSRTLEEARERAFNYLIDFERKSLHSRALTAPSERALSRKAIQVLKNIFARRNEELTQESALKVLYQLAHGEPVSTSAAFVEEMRHLFLAMKEKTGLYESHPSAAPGRDMRLSQLGQAVQEQVEGFAHGLIDGVIQQRKANRQRILDHFGATREEWNDWRWQCRHVIRDAGQMQELVELSGEERAAIDKACAEGIAFGVTPYYVMLMDREPHRRFDHAVRAQVIPPADYVEAMAAGRGDAAKRFDYMGERDTSPERLVTRRYPMIAILKPFNTCAQICVYCQRNWEIDDVLSPKAAASEDKMNKALAWFRQHPEVEEVLITGGDPGIMSDGALKRLLDAVSAFRHIRRIRIGTRTPVVLPMRITDAFADLLASYRLPGRREVVVMTHVEHPYEVTPEAAEAFQRLRQRGLPLYNQAVFTLENARRFEMAALRRLLRLVGVDPYYTFNTKGKEETRAYRAPIARLLQEQAEEARLLPGLARSDEAVFNIPRLGKNYLRAGQDHEVIMVDRQGRRIYEFYPWDMPSDPQPFLFTDVAILDFLQEMEQRGEDPQAYRSIWHYY
ncbi:KamA family radical SAM protein [Heliobacterium gestii]|uniref:KamA family radical SAM protein n=1 Tax=Heliomicrobium gestii TaxID=2699 RepID=A0A845L9N3_HELGE|nr:KamA family radical SAM protein [Heliomicrobium gestii]MBM7868164.1 lysine 2,3-aminomutase [Heliomicrobium gestii]MZP43362.1 KamA family radical SAM protein [Heliomicrobium gestii]